MTETGARTHFTVMGPMGQLLDADHDMLGAGRFLSFETENLMQLDDKAVIPVLLYLFWRIEQRLDGSPTLVLLDEAWSYVRHELFRTRLRDWLKTMRRKNAAVVTSRWLDRVSRTNAQPRASGQRLRQ